MTSKQRLKIAERIARKAKDTKRTTWRELIETIDAQAKTNGGLTWAEFIAQVEQVSKDVATDKTKTDT